MSAPSNPIRCEQAELISAYVMHALPSSDVPGVEAHLAVCAACHEELEMLRPVVDFFVFWPTDVLRPSDNLWTRLAHRIARESGEEPFLPSPSMQQRTEPKWEDVAPGISCKLLATDAENQRVSMLVRLAPGVEYPPHTHTGPEELHLLDGELLINDRTLYPGDFYRAEPGSEDKRVFSDTGCTCVLMTSTKDVIG